MVQEIYGFEFRMDPISTRISPVFPPNFYPSSHSIKAAIKFLKRGGFIFSEEKKNILKGDSF